jgi:hypothetical protein
LTGWAARLVEIASVRRAAISTFALFDAVNAATSAWIARSIEV